MPAPGHTPPSQAKTVKMETRRAEDLSGRPVIKTNPIHRATMKFVLKKILPFLVNWKTTLAGVGLIAHGIGTIADQLHATTDGAPLTLEGMQLAIGEIIAGVGLIAARDANKSSQDSTIR